MRPDWNTYFMNMARVASTRGTCDRKKVGAVIVSQDNHLISTGYNGAPRGWPSCDEVGHELMDVNGRQSCQRTIHAEENAILQAARKGVSVSFTMIYTTAAPCYDCARRIAQVGIVGVYYAEEYKSARSGGQDTLALLDKAGLFVKHLPEVVEGKPASWTYPCEACGREVVFSAPQSAGEKFCYEHIPGIGSRSK
jgi:dCMP deaminase